MSANGLRVLVIGGTRFLGRHFVSSALQAGAQVTLLHRGRTGTELFAECERLIGDRADIAGLIGDRTWDAVVDTCGYLPSHTAGSCAALGGRAGQYVFISSVSAYRDQSTLGLVEDDDLGELGEADPTTFAMELYGALKAACEGEVLRAFGDRATVVRPGLIVGPHDPSDRFTYWPERAARGGEMLAPGSPGRQVQFIDGRDLADWIMPLCANPRCGVYNAVGPQGGADMGSLIEACVAASPAAVDPVWVPDDYLVASSVEAWADLPLWIPESDTEYVGLEHVNGCKAWAAGLVTRPVVDTVRDTMAWAGARPAAEPRKAGLTLEREAELLAAWRSGAVPPRREVPA